MINSSLKLKDYILDFFKNFESAHMMELVNYLHSEMGDMPDFDVLENELTNLSKEEIIKIDNDFIYKISETKQPAKSIEYKLGSFNYVINAEFEHSHNKEMNLELLFESIKTLKNSNEDIRIITIVDLYHDRNKNELGLEVSGDEWEGSILIKEPILRITTIWKEVSFHSEWEDLILSDIDTDNKLYPHLPVASHALFLYYFIKSIILKYHPLYKFSINNAEFRKSQQGQFFERNIE